MSRSCRFIPAGVLAGLALSLLGCGKGGPPKPAGLTLDELKAQNRAPLEIVAFGPSGGVGDSILGMAMDAARDEESPAPAVAVAPRRHKLTVSNVSDRVITSFHCAFTYADANGQAVASGDATPEAAWMPFPQKGLAPGETMELELLLMVPKDAAAKCAFTAMTYQAGALEMKWQPAKAE